MSCPSNTIAFHQHGDKCKDVADTYECCHDPGYDLLDTKGPLEATLARLTIYNNNLTALFHRLYQSLLIFDLLVHATRLALFLEDWRLRYRYKVNLRVFIDLN